MSLLTIEHGALSLGPSFRMEGHRLVARASFGLRLGSLFSYDKRVVIDPDANCIDIAVRQLWFRVRRRRIRFDDIEYIDYGYAGLSTSWGLRADGVGAYDAVETFRIELALRRTDEPFHLFNFSGEGAIETGLFGVLMGDDPIDAKGDQESASRAFVELLSAMTGRPLSPSDRWSEAAIRTGRHVRCGGCRKSIPGTAARCIYCGAVVSRVAG